MTNEEFKMLCRHYACQQKMYERLSEFVSAPMLKENIERKQEEMVRIKTARIELALLSENIEDFKAIFDTVERVNGKEAREALWKAYVVRDSFEDIAQYLSVSKPTLERRLSKWKSDANIN